MTLDTIHTHTLLLKITWRDHNDLSEAFGFVLLEESPVLHIRVNPILEKVV